MAMVWPITHSSHIHFFHSNQKSQVFSRKVKYLSIRKDKHLFVKCLQKDTGVPALESEVIPSTIPQCDVLLRKDFPPDFKLGGSSSALQCEGALNEGGRGPSSWDPLYTDTEERKIACDSYHRYKEDVQLLKNMGADAYRFSISWPRILPNGKLKDGINKEGIKFYHKFIDELLKYGIEPIVTLFHFDQPKALDDEYNGFKSKKIVDDFKDYAEVCFKNFGHKVKQWITINEPQIFCQYGILLRDPNFDAKKEPFIRVHNMLLAHAAASKLYRDNFQTAQGGEIGLAMVCEWSEPYSNTASDKDAANREFDFWIGWIMAPLVYGDYPFIMRALAGDVLPVFTDEEKEMLKGSCDFLGFNYYTSNFAKALPISPNDLITTLVGYRRVETGVTNVHGKLIGPKATGGNVYYYPEGLRKALIHTKESYGNIKVYIAENGYPEVRDDTIPIQKSLEDDYRINFIKGHLDAIRKAINEGANVKGYFAWSMLDLFESSADTNVRFGLNYVDFTDDLKRYPKKSAEWFRSFNDKVGNGKS